MTAYSIATNDPGDGLGPYVEVRLTRGLVAWVSPEDYGAVAARSWYAQPRPTGNHYAATSTTGPGGERAMLLMHRALLQLDSGTQVDHRNGNGLDNRRANLRPCSHGENQCNRRKLQGTRSRFRGVTPSRWKAGRWCAEVKANGVRRHLGTFDSEEAAAVAYARAAAELHGAFYNPKLTVDGLALADIEPIAQARAGYVSDSRASARILAVLGELDAWVDTAWLAHRLGITTKHAGNVMRKLYSAGLLRRRAVGSGRRHEWRAGQDRPGGKG
jgi:hypothetical protein